MAIVMVRNHKSIVLLGTGFLVHVGEARILITASHVIQEAYRLSSTIGIAAPGGNFIAMCEDWRVTTSPNDPDSDHIDVAAHRLNDEEISRLGNATFNRQNDAEERLEAESSIYAIFGYPGIWSAPIVGNHDKLKIKGLQLLTWRYEGKTSSFPAYARSRHLLLDAKQINNFDYNGTQVSLKNIHGFNCCFPRDLGGMSGSSVWRIDNFSKCQLNCRHENARLAGVLTSGYSGVFKVTRWIEVFTFIQAAFPDLRTASHTL